MHWHAYNVVSSRRHACNVIGTYTHGDMLPACTGPLTLWAHTDGTSQGARTRSYSTQQTCLRNADKVYSKARDALYLATPDSTRKQGGTIACQAATQCEKEWLTYYESKVGMTKCARII